MKQGLSSFGGTFISPESGARGDNAKATTAFMPETAEEQDPSKDPLYRRRLSTRTIRSPYPHTETQADQHGRMHRHSFRSQLACWPMTERFVDPSEIVSNDLNPEQLLMAQEECAGDEELRELILQ